MKSSLIPFLMMACCLTAYPSAAADEDSLMKAIATGKRTDPNYETTIMTRPLDQRLQSQFNPEPQEAPLESSYEEATPGSYYPDDGQYYRDKGHYYEKPEFHPKPSHESASSKQTYYEGGGHYYLPPQDSSSSAEESGSSE